MKTNKQCPDCQSELIKNQKLCDCGWKENGKVKKEYFCSAMHLGVRCGKTIELISIGNGHYWCEQHYTEMRPKNDIQKEIDHCAKVYTDAAKTAGMTNRELAEDLFPQLFKPKKQKSEEQLESVKQILNKQNPLFANLIK